METTTQNVKFVIYLKGQKPIVLSDKMEKSDVFRKQIEELKKALIEKNSARNFTISNSRDFILIPDISEIQSIHIQSTNLDKLLEKPDTVKKEKVKQVIIPDSESDDLFDLEETEPPIETKPKPQVEKIVEKDDVDLNALEIFENWEKELDEPVESPKPRKTRKPKNTEQEKIENVNTANNSK